MRADRVEAGVEREGQIEVRTEQVADGFEVVQGAICIAGAGQRA